MSDYQMPQVAAIRTDSTNPASNITTLHTGAVLLLAALAAMGPLATNIILPAFPSMARDLGASISQLSRTLSSFFLVFGLEQLVVGPLSDRFGRQRLALCGLSMCSVRIGRFFTRPHCRAEHSGVGRVRYSGVITCHRSRLV